MGEQLNLLKQTTLDYLMGAARRVYGMRGPRVVNNPDGIWVGDTPMPSVTRPLWQNAGGGGVARVRVVSNATGGGKYMGHVVAPPATAIVATGDLADSDLGTNLVPDVLIVNAAEAGKSTHDLTTGTPVQKTFIGFYLGMSGDAIPVPVYQINGFDPADCTTGA